MRKFLMAWLVASAFLGWAGSLSGQEVLLPEEEYRLEPIERHDLDRDTWREVTRNLNYFDDKDRRTAEEANQRRGPMGNEEAPPPRRQRQVSPWLQYLGTVLIKVLIIAGAALVLFLLLRALLGIELAPRNRKVRKESSPDIDFDKIEDNLQEADLESFILRAESAGQYALALRLYYLELLRQLAAAGLIRWKKGKTNHDYEHELRLTGHAAAFRQLTSIFERTWYGEARLDARAYRELAPRFREAAASIPLPASISHSAAASHEE